MIALHISILDQSPVLWSEGDVPGDMKELDRAMEAIGISVTINKTTTKKATAWLPCRGERPVPSSPLIGPKPDGRLKASLRPFSITAFPLDIIFCHELFALAEEGNIPGSGVLFDNSVAWASMVHQVSLSMVQHQMFLPSLYRDKRTSAGRWVPFPDQATATHLSKLAETMPPVCRCLSKESATPPSTGRIAGLRMLLGFMIDSIIRISNVADASFKKPSSIHDAWLDSLTGIDPNVAWPKEEALSGLELQLQEWRRPIDLYACSPFNFCFRLSEPPEQSRSKKELWQVSFLLQDKSDPSLLVDAAELWSPESAASEQLRRSGAEPAEFMLTALGQASALYPALTTSLKKKKPGGLNIETEAAFIFLTEYAEVLREAGFVVILPAWWVGRGPLSRIGIKAKVRSSAMPTSGSGLTLDTLIACDFAASLGNEECDHDELQRLAELKMPLVRMRGQWRVLDQRELAEAVRFLEKQRSGEFSARDLLATEFGVGTTVDGVTLSSVDASGWFRELMQTLSGASRYELLQPPEGFCGTLRQYQVNGYSWLSFLRKWRLGACLADDMGLGKTVQTLALLQHAREEGESRPVLLICPTSVVNNWRKEAEQFTPNLAVLIHHGADRLKSAAFRKKAAQSALVISSYGLLQRDIETLSDMEWAGVILDEAQNIKNPLTKQSKAARAVPADYRIALTGTPVENHIGDLWALMDFLNPGFLGNRTFFKDNFFYPIQWYGDTSASERLKTMTGPFILRRLKTDRTIISDLPDKIIMKQYCTLTKEQVSLYKAVVDDLEAQVMSAEGIDRRGLVLALLLKLKQVCNHPAQFLGDNSAIDNRSGKLQRLTELLVDIRENGERTLVFTQFAEMGTILQRYLQELFGEEVFFLHGRLLKSKRDAMVDAFQNNEHAPRIFILSLKAGGSGLTLTRANHVVHYDRWWNPAVENQATDRAFRIGQKKNVAVHTFITSGTLEERIDDMIERKTAISGTVLGTGEQWLTELSNKELKHLIMLGHEATGE